MTTVTGRQATCRVQRVTLSSGERTWTVLGAEHRPVGPAEEFLEYLRVQRVSPNTVKSYARALALWWDYLQRFGLGWDSVTLEDFGGFLTWLRTGEDREVVSIEPGRARFAESTVAVRLRAVLSCTPITSSTASTSVGSCIGSPTAAAATTSRCWSTSPGGMGAAKL